MDHSSLFVAANLDHTLFFVVGIALVVLALVIAFVGMRSERFPSTGVLRVGVALVAVVVIATGYSAVKISQAEQSERQEEIREAEAEGEGEGEAVASDDDPSSEEDAAPEVGSSESVDQAGAQLFVGTGCGSCHTLATLGDDAAGATGPNLDEALVNRDTAFIETAIVDPSAEVAEGFSDDIMPSYDGQFTAEELDQLVQFLAMATDPEGPAGGGDSDGGGAQGGGGGSSPGGVSAGTETGPGAGKAPGPAGDSGFDQGSAKPGSGGGSGGSSN